VPAVTATLLWLKRANRLLDRLKWCRLRCLPVLCSDGKYAEAARALAAELQNFPRSRAALSLLGYCYYYMQVRWHVLMGV
jgi:hypothetical protein